MVDPTPAEIMAAVQAVGARVDGLRAELSGGDNVISLWDNPKVRTWIGSLLSTAGVGILLTIGAWFGVRPPVIEQAAVAPAPPVVAAAPVVERDTDSRP